MSQCHRSSWIRRTTPPLARSVLAGVRDQARRLAVRRMTEGPPCLPSPAPVGTLCPIPAPRNVGLTTYDANDPDTSFPPIEALRPPAGAPNVLIVLIDDAGFGSSSAFGGPCQTPNAERLAANGLKFNRFHTTALCSPTRQALLTGRNHHSVGMGGITEIATSAPGYSSVRPIEAAPLAEMLQLNGFSTAQFGKCHEVPVWETSPMGPFRQWPTGSGFEYFYGFIGGETNQWYPALYEGTDAGRAAEDPGGGLPPHRGPDRQGDRVGAPAEVADARQAVLHVLRARRDARAAPRAQGVGRQVPGPVRPGLGRAARGDARPPEGARRRAGRRRAHRASRRHPGVGRHARKRSARCSPARWRSTRGSWSTPTTTSAGSIDALDDLGVLDDTLVYFIVGDNGASAEGGINGTFNEMFLFNGAADFETPESMAARIDEFGTPDAVQPLRGRLGPRDGHAVPVDEAGRVALGRDPQRHDRALAERVRGTRRGPLAVPPRDRHRRDGPRRRRASGADVRERHPPDAAARREHGVRVRRRRTRRSGARRSTSRCSATAASTTRAGPR